MIHYQLTDFVLKKSIAYSGIPAFDAKTKNDMTPNVFVESPIFKKGIHNFQDIRLSLNFHRP